MHAHPRPRTNGNGRIRPALPARYCATLAVMAIGFAAATTSTTGCLVDPNNPCGVSQELSADGACVCVSGAIPDASNGGCSTCGTNEVAAGTACACATGYVRMNASSDCLQSLQGATCDNDANPCADPDQDHCQMADGAAEGYCTMQNCASSDDCAGDYACAMGASPTYCKRPPTGQSQACTSDADCAGMDASFCEPFGSVCLVPDCTVGEDSCHEAWRCCDLTTTIIPGYPDSMCVPVANLDQLIGAGATCPEPS